MALQPVCSSFHSSRTEFSRNHSVFRRLCSSSEFFRRSQRFELASAAKSSVACSSWWAKRKLPVLRLSGVVRCSNSDLEKNTVSYDLGNVSPIKNDGLETSRGKPGSVSFYGSTHQMVEETEFDSSSPKEGTGSFQWVLAPLALILSLVLPPLIVGNLADTFIKEAILAETVASLFSEAAFYIGLAAFLFITDRVQRPYLQFTTKKWSLITGLKGYLTSDFIVTAFRIIVPSVVLGLTWPEIELAAVVSVAPFLASCLAQNVFELSLTRRGSSCWPLVPIIFEMYRIFQLTRASQFIESLMHAMNGQESTPKLLARANALIVMLVLFQALGIICLWSLITFLIRLVPSRPVAE